MQFRIAALAAFVVIFAATVAGCTNASQPGEEGSAESAYADQEGHDSESAGEHARENGADSGGEAENGEEGGEESGTEYALDATYDTVRRGVRLVMAYDAENNAFSGTVENVTSQVLESVRVEVHLSNGIELGPTTPGDLEPGQKRSVLLNASEASFSGWTPHAEVGRNEHGAEGSQS